MKKNIENYVFVKQNFLDNEFCQNTIEKLNQLNAWKKHNWVSYNYNQEQQLDMSSPQGENEPDITSNINIKLDFNDFILEKISKVIIKYIDSLKFEWFNNVNALTNLKFLKYSPGQTMENHCDHIHEIFDGTKKGIPVFSIIGLLNDDFEGGNFVMFGDKKINMKEGDLIIFPSLFLFPHEVKPITKGIRYSYITWLW